MLSIGNEQLYINKLNQSLQQYHQLFANDFIISLGSSFDITRDLSIQSVDEQSKSNKFKKHKIVDISDVKCQWL